MIIRALTTRPFQQRGAVLFISLIILVVITLIGVTAMQTTTLDMKITGNNKNYRTSFEAAEAALTEAQSRLGITQDQNLSAKFPRPRIGTSNGTNLKIWDMQSDKPTRCSVDPNSTTRDPWWFQWDLDCWKNNAIEFSGTLYGLETTSGQAAVKPLYLIEYEGRLWDFLNTRDYGDLPPKDYYRITARGSIGQNSQADVFLQAVFAWRYRDN